MNYAIITALFIFSSIQFVSIFGEISLINRALFNFTVNLMQKTAKDDKSAILSPFSVSTSLFMVYLATNGKTKEQLQKILGGTARTSDLRKQFANQIADSAKIKSKKYKLNVANRFCVRKGFPVKDSFKRMLRLYYNETVHEFSFEKRKGFVQGINKWISRKTNKKIKDLIKEDSINKDTNILLMNAIYFKATWKNQFMKAVTKEREFHISEKEKKPLNIIKAPYYEDNLVQVIKLPYTHTKIEMVFILPKARFGLSNVLAKLTGEDLFKYINDTKRSSVTVIIPKFQVEEKLDLKDALQKIGITDIFSAASNFRELVNTTVPVSVGKIMHAGFIEIDEKGTESTAVTVVDLINRSASQHRFVADHPFLFAIVNNLETVLFIGQYVK
uniref:Serpin domain-containing protein n=1 Tax=Wuchereria bancrofti TaxID=6293 RepID=A0AAF5PLP2_WUCBA